MGDVAPGICASLVFDNIIRDLVVTLWSAQPLTEMRARNISQGVKAAGA
jgi:hypothetical protein